jgi:hypothetical protein
MRSSEVERGGICIHARGLGEANTFPLTLFDSELSGEGVAKTLS